MTRGQVVSVCLLLIAILLVWAVPRTACFAQNPPEDEELKVNRLTNVGGYAPNHLAGSMALYALNAIMTSQGKARYYENLLVESGAIFKFVYDTTEAYEPLRDISPVDLLHNAAAANGFPDAHWETGLTMAEVRDLIKHEIDAGRPLITPFLKGDEYHTFNIITGYDYERNELWVQGAFNRRRSFQIPIPDAWDGPTMSPAGWSTNPLFVLGKGSVDSATVTADFTDLIREGIGLLEGGTMEYGRHEGEAAYMLTPGPHLARYGLPAYELLVEDVGEGDLTRVRGGEEELNLGLVWRIDVMVGLLESDRLGCSKFVTFLRRALPADLVTTLLQLSDNYDLTLAEATQLHDAFSQVISDSLIDPGEVVEYVKTSPAVIFRLPDSPGLADNLKSRGLAVYETQWGRVLVDDSHDKRIWAKTKAISLMSREHRSLALLKDIAHYLETGAVAEPPAEKAQSPAEEEPTRQTE